MKLFRKIVLFIAFGSLIFWGGYQFGKKDNLSLKPLQENISIVNRQTPVTKNVDFSLFWEVWSRLERFYVDKTKLNPQKMVYGAISGMVYSLGDPYTVFLDPQQSKDSKEELSGQFEGVGMQLGLKEKKIVVIAPLRGTPAERAGIKAGDFIAKVNGQETAGWTLPEAVAKIRGQKGSKVKITIIRDDNKPKEMELVRDTILVNSVELNNNLVNQIKKKEELGKTPAEGNQQANDEKAPKVAYLKLSRFGDDTNREWDKSVSEIVKNWQLNKTKGLILDLRNNPGGYLSGAVYIASEFIDKGIVVKQQRADGTTQTYSVNRQGKLITIPLVILINKGSASASEILAGCLRDYQRATLVGEKTFGKGSIQEVQDLPNNTSLHVTTAKWLLPKGEWINGKGIEPDVKIENNEKKPEEDLQLQKAIEILEEKIQ